MIKTLTINTIDDVNHLEIKVISSMKKVAEQLRNESADPYLLFTKMKFGGVGLDPLNSDRELNLVEQINQSFTYLASFYALEVLFDLHADLAPYVVHLGTTPGSDIESQDGSLSAEVFASVTPNNNQKLKNDIDKVSKTSSHFKYSFFMCPNFEAGRQVKLERNDVIVWALKCVTAL